MPEDFEKDQLIERLLNDLIDLNRQAVEHNTHLAVEYRGLIGGIDSLRKEAEALRTELSGKGNEPGIHEKIRRINEQVEETKNLLKNKISQEEDASEKIEKLDKKVDTMGTKIAIQWWFIGGITIMLLGVIGAGLKSFMGW